MIPTHANTKRNRSALLLVLSTALAASPAQLLHSDGPQPSFEVAAIKPTPSTARPIRRAPLGASQIVQIDGTELSLVGTAYNVDKPGQLVGEPGWNDSKRYLVEAKIPDDLFAKMQDMTRDQRAQQVRLMLQSLCADRLKLKVHFATRDVPIYNLVQDKGGAKLPPPDSLPGTGTGGLRMSNGKVEVRNTKLDDFAQFMSSLRLFGLDGRSIVNQTGLSGAYTFTFDWNPPTTRSDADPLAANDDPGPTIFDALHDQLGLKLVPSTGPIETLYIDHIEPPSDN